LNRMKCSFSDPQCLGQNTDGVIVAGCYVREPQVVLERYILHSCDHLPVLGLRGGYVAVFVVVVDSGERNYPACPSYVVLCDVGYRHSAEGRHIAECLAEEAVHINIDSAMNNGIGLRIGIDHWKNIWQGEWVRRAGSKAGNGT